MTKLLASFLLIAFCTVLADESVHDADLKRPVQEWFNRLKDESGAIAIAPLSEIPEDLRTSVCMRMIRSNVRVGEALVTLQRFSDRFGFDDICKALGPRLRLAAANDLLGTVEGKLPPHFPRFKKILRELDDLPQNAESQLIKLASHDDAAHAEAAFELMEKLPAASGKVVSCLRTGMKNRDATLRSAALKAVGSLEATDLLEDCRPLLLDPIPDVAIAAAKTMLLLDEKEMAPIHVLNDMFLNPEFRSWQAKIADALGNAGPRALVAKNALLLGIHAKSEWNDAIGFKFDTGVSPHVLDVLSGIGSELLDLMAEWLRSTETRTPARTRILRHLIYCEWPIDSIKPELYQQLVDGDEEVVLAAIRALSRCDEVDAGKLAAFVGGNDQIREAVATALARASNDSRVVARKKLPTLMGDKESQVAIAACASHWGLFRDLHQVTAHLERLLVKSSYVNLESERDFGVFLGAIEVPPDQLIQTLLNVIKTGDESERLVAVSRLGCFGASAAHALIDCLKHQDPNVRSRSVAALANTGDPRSVKAIAKLLDDAELFSRSISNHLSWSLPVRKAAIEGLANPKLDATEVLPRLMRLLDDELLGADAVVATRNIGQSASVAIPKLRSAKVAEANRYACEVLTTLATLDPSPANQLAAMNQLLDLVENSELPAFYSDCDFDLSLTELEKSGKRYPELDARLRHFVLDHDFLHEDFRVQAAYALAIFFPKEVRWKKYIQVRSDGSFGNVTAEDRWLRLTTGVGIDGE